MILIDKAGHLISDDLNSDKELHNFALKIGIKKCWFHGGKNKIHHYDLTTTKKINLAIEFGAKLISSKEIIKIKRRPKIIKWVNTQKRKIRNLLILKKK